MRWAFLLPRKKKAQLSLLHFADVIPASPEIPWEWTNYGKRNDRSFGFDRVSDDSFDSRVHRVRYNAPLLLVLKIVQVISTKPFTLSISHSIFQIHWRDCVELHCWLLGGNWFSVPWGHFWRWRFRRDDGGVPSGLCKNQQVKVLVQTQFLEKMAPLLRCFVSKKKTLFSEEVCDWMFQLAQHIKSVQIESGSGQWILVTFLGANKCSALHFTLIWSFFPFVFFLSSVWTRSGRRCDCRWKMW